MSLNDISQALTPYPQAWLHVFFGAGLVGITIKCEKLGELYAGAPNEQEAVDSMLKLIESKKSVGAQT